MDNKFIPAITRKSICIFGDNQTNTVSSANITFHNFEFSNYSPQKQLKSHSKKVKFKIKKIEISNTLHLNDCYIYFKFGLHLLVFLLLFGGIPFFQFHRYELGSERNETAVHMCVCDCILGIRFSNFSKAIFLKFISVRV